MQDFSFLCGKTISVVGNAKSMLQFNHGSEIDSNDVAIRMNRAVPKNSLSQGTRTDILAFSTFFHIADVYQDFHSARLVWMSPKRRREATKLGASAVRFFTTQAAGRHLQVGSGRVGTMVLDILTSVSPGQVSIYGFDFKRTGTSYEVEPLIGPHDCVAEQRYCEELASEFGWKLIRDFRDEDLGYNPTST